MTAIRLCFAQGGSAVITLVMPPPGGEGYSALQSGAALSEGAASMYYNPANLAELQRAAGSQIFYTGSNQKLLPTLRLPDLYQNFNGIALVFPDRNTGVDLGIGAHWNYVNFGDNPVTDENGLLVGKSRSDESVYSLGAGLRLGVPISIGVGAKYFDSYLAKVGSFFNPRRQYISHAFGWAFDLGVLSAPIPALKSVGSGSIRMTGAFAMDKSPPL